MKKLIKPFIIFVLSLLLNPGLFAQEPVRINERFSAGESHTYNFYLSSNDVSGKVYLIIYGTDYDYDSDGDYTDFAVTVNGEQLFYAKELTTYGLGKDGSKSEMKYDISDYVTSGSNSLTLQNTENAGQRDYCYIEWFKVAGDASSESYQTLTSLFLNQKKYVSHKFPAQTTRKYIFPVSDISAARNAKLILSGYDSDYDNDGDYTDFAVIVNGTALFEFESLESKGFGSDGNSKNLILDIGAYLQEGTNEIVLKNTEIQGQVDYVYIGSIEVADGNPQTALQATLNSPFLLAKRFNSSDQKQVSFYISDINSYDDVKLKLSGTDVDQDMDGDYTDFLLQINSTVLIDTKSLTENGLGMNGAYADAVFNIKPYLTNGNNIVLMRNTEDKGQVDYVYIKSLEIIANKNYVVNVPPVITITKPELSRGFKIVNSSTMIVEGIASDDDGIRSVYVNSVKAQSNYGGIFKAEIPVSPGMNQIQVIATDNKGMSGYKTFSIDIKNNSVSGGELLGQTGKYYALIIGVSDYDDPAIPDLLGEPTKDAHELYNILTQQYTFNPQDVKLLLNPTYRQIIRSFDDFAKKITENDNFLIFYAGHGNWDEQTEIGYWLPKDAELGYTDAWLYNSVLVDNIRKVNSKHTLLIADACFSGGIFKARSLLPNAPKAIKQKYELKSRNAITSGALKTVPNRSVFFKYLSDRLKNNTEKYLSASQLYRKIEIPVGNNSPNVPQYGDIRNAGDEGGDFIFIRK